MTSRFTKYYYYSYYLQSYKYFLVIINNQRHLSKSCLKGGHSTIELSGGHWHSIGEIESASVHSDSMNVSLD